MLGYTLYNLSFGYPYNQSPPGNIIPCTICPLDILSNNHRQEILYLVQFVLWISGLDGCVDVLQAQAGLAQPLQTGRPGFVIKRKVIFFIHIRIVSLQLKEKNHGHIIPVSKSQAVVRFALVRPCHCHTVLVQSRLRFTLINFVKLSAASLSESDL